MIRRASVLACVLAVCVCGARADDVDERMEALLEKADAQRERIAALETQLAARQQPDVEQARVDLLRDQIREVLRDESFREHLLPTSLQAGYERGFFIRSSDNAYYIRFNGRMQLRYTYANIGQRNRYLAPGFRRDDRSGFDGQRIRLTVRGHIITPNLAYYVQWRSGVDGNYNTRLRDAYVNYRFADALQFRAGMFKVAATLSELTSSGSLQFVDRPVWNAVYGFGRGMGVRLWGTLAERRCEYYVDVLNSLGAATNLTITPDPNEELDGVPGIAFRFVWNALGDDPGRDFVHEADLEYHTNPALMFAFYYAFNNDNGDADTLEIPFPAPGFSGIPGGFGLTSTRGLQINQFGLAAAFKYRGFSARGEYALRLVDPRRTSPPLAPWFQLTGDDSTTAQQGGYVQCGYFLPIPGFERKIEVVGRVGVISTLASELELAWEYAGGVNYYIRGDNVKLQADVTRIPEAPISSSSASIPNVNDDALVFRAQLQVAF